MQTRIATFVAGALATAIVFLVPQPASAAPVTADVKADSTPEIQVSVYFNSMWALQAFQTKSDATLKEL